MMQRHTCSRRGFLETAATCLLGPSLLPLSNMPARAQRRVPVVDSHVHFGIPPEEVAPTSDALTVPWTTTSATPEEMLRMNEEAGIDMSVVMPITPSGARFCQFEKANERVARLCRQYPGKFIGCAKHDPVAEKGRIRRMLLKEYHDLGIRELKLHGHPTQEILNTVAELRIPILYHPRRVARFEEVVADWPKINFILAHMGRDEEPYARYVANRYSNAYLDTSNVVTTRHIEQAVEDVPAEKIIFGSDENLVDCRIEIFKIRVLKLPKEKEKLILGGNILRLLGETG